MNEVTEAINQFSTLLEDQNAKLDAILEGQKDQATRTNMRQLEGRLDSLESDVRTITAAVTDTNRDLAKHTHASADAPHSSEYTAHSHWTAA